MLPKTDWAPLIPHAGAMCLLDAVLDWNARAIDARSASHARADNPLRGGHGLHAIHLVEYAAQAAAVHGALLARTRGDAAPRAGLLVSVRDAELHVEWVDPAGELDVHADCLHADPGSAQYAYRVAQRGRVLATGRLAILHPDGQTRTP